MNRALIETLNNVNKRPALVVVLYKQLFEGHFWAIAQRSTKPLDAISFLSYPSAPTKREIPLFTDPKRHLLTQLGGELDDSMIIEVEGKSLWPKMLDIVKTREFVIAIDPGENHGIRLTHEIILGMVKVYSN